MYEYAVIGIGDCSFNTKDGKTISGTRVILAQPIDPDKGQGMDAFAIFVTPR